MEEYLSGAFGAVLINDIVVIYLFSYMHRTFYDKKDWFKAHVWVPHLVYLLDFLLLARVNESKIFILNMLFTVICYIGPLYLMYRVNNFRGLTYYVFWMLGGFAIELISAAFMGSLRNGSYDQTAYYDGFSLGSTIVVTLLEAVLMFAICYFGNKDKKGQYNKVTAVFAIVPLASVLLIIIDHVRLLGSTNAEYNEAQYLDMVIVLSVVNIVFFIVLEKFTAMMKREFELRMVELELQSDRDVMRIAADSMRERLSSAEELVKQDRTMRHDRRHFEALLYSLAQEGDIEEIKKCLEERMAQEPRTIGKYCENTTVNAAINHYVSMAEKKEIPIKVETNIPAKLSVDDMQLAITISNLIENAIHACEDLPKEDRHIEVIAKYKSQLLLEISNSCARKAKLDDEGHPVTDESGHGVGTRSVLAFVKQTDSDIHYIAEDNLFKVRMIV